MGYQTKRIDPVNTEKNILEFVAHLFGEQCDFLHFLPFFACKNSDFLRFRRHKLINSNKIRRFGSEISALVYWGQKIYIFRTSGIFLHKGHALFLIRKIKIHKFHKTLCLWGIKRNVLIQWTQKKIFWCSQIICFANIAVFCIFAIFACKNSDFFAISATKINYFQ